ncbi:MAG: polyamine aminopropyltransferase [Clostridiales bacterium]
MDLWYTEFQTETIGLTCKTRKTLHTEKTDFQEIAIIDTYQFGKMLVLDGTVQTTEVDEHIYHEMISHVPLLTHKNPKKVLVIGGGDGGAIREVIKHKSVEKAVLVEIDKRVVELSKKYFPNISSDLENDLVEVRIEDGIKYIDDNKNVFDVILIDSTDPVGPAEGLFSKDFYKSVFEALKEDGIMVAQTESPYFHKKLIKNVNDDLKGIFPIVNLYTCPIPTYPSGFWSFTLASKVYDPTNKSVEDLDFNNTKYFNEDIYRSCFLLPKFMKDVLK